MAIPDFQTLMRPLLALLDDGEEWPARAIRDALASQFALTADELEERLPSGRDTTFRNRVGWALTHVYQASLVDRPRRAVYHLTDRGRTLLATEPTRVDLAVLNQFDEFRAFRLQPTAGSDVRPTPTPGAATTPAELSVSGTPEERAEAAYRELRSVLRTTCSTAFENRRPTSSSRSFSTCCKPSATAAHAKMRHSAWDAPATAASMA